MPTMEQVLEWQEAFDREEAALMAQIAKGLADNLATAMRVTGVDVSKLSMLSAVSSATIREVLAGERIVGPTTLQRLAYALGYRLRMNIVQADD